MAHIVKTFRYIVLDEDLENVVFDAAHDGANAEAGMAGVIDGIMSRNIPGVVKVYWAADGEGDLEHYPAIVVETESDHDSLVETIEEVIRTITVE